MSEARKSSWCTKCGEFMLYDTHTCPPLFHVQCQDWHGDDDWDGIYARSPESAAEKWAERHDSNGDYDIVSGNEATLRVRNDDDADETITTWTVTGEAVPRYSATAAEQSES